MSSPDWEAAMQTQSTLPRAEPSLDRPRCPSPGTFDVRPLTWGHGDPQEFLSREETAPIPELHTNCKVSFDIPRLPRQLAQGRSWEWSLGALGPVVPGCWAGMPPAQSSARSPASCTSPHSTCGGGQAWQPRAGLGYGTAGACSPLPSRPARAGAWTGPPGQLCPSWPVLGDLHGGGLGGVGGTEAFMPWQSPARPPQRVSL